MTTVTVTIVAICFWGCVLVACALYSWPIWIPLDR